MISSQIIGCRRAAQKCSLHAAERLAQQACAQGRTTMPNSLSDFAACTVRVESRSTNLCRRTAPRCARTARPLAAARRCSWPAVACTWAWCESNACVLRHLSIRLTVPSGKRRHGCISAQLRVSFRTGTLLAVSATAPVALTVARATSQVCPQPTMNSRVDKLLSTRPASVATAKRSGGGGSNMPAAGADTLGARRFCGLVKLPGSLQHPVRGKGLE